MPLTLILTRHAKSAWDDPTVDDFDRTLNGRGRSDAPKIGEWLAAQGFLPDTVLVSGARRTVETWERMAPTLPKTCTMESAPARFHASAQTILDVLKTRRSPSIMIICHNPGIAEFARRIVNTPPDHPKFSQYPTCATAVIEFDAPAWSAIDWETGALQDFIVPKDL